ncbi:S41 family peptidase [Paraflavitalea pollutisoli]|uniref:S41 family peptidase n=1 Tax=Paraflavitalea pollutisoli TaxID=3034143 RepID=UPI0023ED6B4E|nr:S41 family peptidase [Paraflavitalea sp. H1-2-19X]
MQRYLLFGLLLMGSFANGQSGRASAAGMTTTLLSGQDSALQLFEQALTYIQRNPFKKELAWDSLVCNAREQLSDASTVRDAYAAINQCLQQVRGGHSFLMPAKRAALYHNDTTSLKRSSALHEVMGTITARLEDGNIGYLEVPWISTTDKAICTRIADSLQTLIGQLADRGATRWVIDLRRNSGGNCWPMLAGMGPLLGDGVCGFFVRSGKATGFKYEAGAALYGTNLMCRVSQPIALTAVQRKQIVVLTGPKTSSSGEILALAFKGMPNAKHIGEPTAGFTTANTTYSLLDGSTLVMSISQEADRTGRIYEGKIAPDELVRAGNPSEDTVKGRALMWLQSL